MHTRVRNVNEAFNTFVTGIQSKCLPTTSKSSRAGKVLKIDEPVLLTFTNPTERVLFNQARDCNPFFHVFESLWMLAGRNDVAPLQYYSSKIGEVASDNGSTFNGAYGWRWRKHPGKPVGLKGVWYTRAIDQLPILIEHLKSKPESRRAVLQMWRVVDDLLKIDARPNPDCDRCNGSGVIEGLVGDGQSCNCITPATKDVCCNTAAYFSLRKVYSSEDSGGVSPWGQSIDVPSETTYLDMTVTNRSNDLIWGLLGANVVHFSFLQEYMACALGVEVGHYHQFANDLHVYTENNGGFKPELWLEDNTPDLYRSSSPFNRVYIPLVRDVKMFDKEVNEFVEANGKLPKASFSQDWNEPFLEYVAKPMMEAFHHHKERMYNIALDFCNQIEATDWRLAATNWITKRRDNYLAKKEGQA